MEEWHFGHWFLVEKEPVDKALEFHTKLYGDNPDY